ncbi:hypothetical protein [Baekduia sp.]|jgi:hypothetical protein|uniref:hypothetical protein n=1 Tax=Baekduia sp. TaxID=2600305 RepID=UPI002DFA4C4D|nr:hypothetical protein [Baekduia sp.]
MADRKGMGRFVTRAVILVLLLAMPASASAATRMYVSTARAVDGTVSISGYALDGTTQIQDGFQLDLIRGGVTVDTTQAPDFVLLTPSSLLPGDEIVLTDTTTSATHTATFTGNPTLTAPSCGTSAFSGARDEGATVDVSASMGAESVPTVQRFGAGITYSGSFAKALTTGWTVQASQGRVIDAEFTVFDALSAVVGGTCPVVTPPEDPPAPPAPAPVLPTPPVPDPTPPASVPSGVPAPADSVAPLGRLTVRTKPTAAYKALVAGTFTVSVTVNEPGTVTERLVSGKTTVATASKSAKKAGAVTLRLALSKSGRRRLARSKSTTLTLTTRLRDTAGNVRTLSPRRLTATRAR